MNLNERLSMLKEHFSNSDTYFDKRIVNSAAKGDLCNISLLKEISGFEHSFVVSIPESSKKNVIMNSYPLAKHGFDNCYNRFTFFLKFIKDVKEVKLVGFDPCIIYGFEKNDELYVHYSLNIEEKSGRIVPTEKVTATFRGDKYEGSVLKIIHELFEKYVAQPLEKDIKDLRFKDHLILEMFNYG